MIYDYYKEQNKRGIGKKLAVVLAVIVFIWLLIQSAGIYLKVIELKELNKAADYSQVYIKNLLYQIIFFIVSFVFIFLYFRISSIFIKKNIASYCREKDFKELKLPNTLIALAAGFFGAVITKEFFYQKALSFLNSVSFGKSDPLLNKDIGYYVFQRPFLMSLYSFVLTVSIIIIIYTALYYLIAISVNITSVKPQDLKVKTFVRHILVNVAIFFLIMSVSFKFSKEGLLFGSFTGLKGAGFVDVNIWQKFYIVAPFLLIAIVIIAFLLLFKGRLKRAAGVIVVFPVLWVIIAIISGITQVAIVNPNEINKEASYIKHNMEQTRSGYGLDKVKTVDFPDTKILTPDIINRNKDTINNIRIVDYQATLDSNVQLQSNTNFYTFKDGDIINYTINGKEIPIFICAREIDKSKLSSQTYVNTMFRYTHGYGVVINPINQLTPEGQVQFILSGLKMDSQDPNLKISQPRIYYGEYIKDHVIVNPPGSNKIKEIDYDGNVETNYDGKGGIKLNWFNRLLYMIVNRDYNFLVSGNIDSNSKLLINRQVIDRAKLAVPFLEIDDDPYITLDSNGRLKWVLDAYTSTEMYPYAQEMYTDNHGSFNYIRNSVKVVIDAYDGTVEYYIIDKTDPIIKAYDKMYPGLFQKKDLPKDIATHTRYPEFLFKVQTEMMKNYHIDPNAAPGNVNIFYSKNDLWEIAKYPVRSDQITQNAQGSDIMDIDPYYNMIKLPGGVGQKEELIQMRPFTPSGQKTNMISWMAVRNSYENYGELVLFKFPKNTNILGPQQVESNINAIDKVSSDMTLWGQSGSRVFKGSLLAIPIEDTVLYVEPIYIQSSGTTSIPQVREVIVGYQKGEEFKYGIGTNLQNALNDLFEGKIEGNQQNQTATQPQQTPQTGVDQKVINDIIAKFNEAKKSYDLTKSQLDELEKLIDSLKK